MPSSPARPAIEWRLDYDNHIRFMNYVGDVGHDQLVDELPKIWRQIPDILHFHTVVDMRRHTGSVHWETVKEVDKLWRAAYGDAATSLRTALVAKHMGFATLTKAIQAHITTHNFKAFESMEEAIQWLRASPPPP